jgi:threonine/homoserine/homoserine lactone efflux protein
LAASGATIGVRRSLSLVPAELAGYLISIGLLSAVAGPFLAAAPALASLLKLAAAAYLALSAYRLWRGAAAEFGAVPAPASPQRVFLTTLLNPKALVFALVIFPAAALAPAALIALFALLVTLAGSAWITIGATVGRALPGPSRPALISRISAIALSLFAMLIAGSAVAGGF